MTIPPAKMAAYRATMERRDEMERQQCAGRRQRAWETARQSATLLKERFGASRVVVFGSLPRDDGFTIHSDIDLAVWGIDPLEYLEALGCLLDLSPEWSVDLVQMERCPLPLRDIILEEGRML
jgi:uncharacterized protein